MNSDKKIEVLHYGLSPRLGGIETSLKKIFDNIDTSRFKSSYIKVADKLFFEDYLSQNGAKFYYIGSRKNIIKHYQRLNQLFKDNHFDIVHVSINTYSAADIVYVALRHKCKIIVHSRSSKNMGTWITNVLHKINRFCLRKADITRIAVSDIAGQWLFGGGAKYSVYPNSVELCAFYFDENLRDKTRKEYNIKDNEIIIGNIGRLTYPKNQKFLISLLPTLNKEYRLMLVGDGKDRDKLVALSSQLGVADRVIFAGVHNNPNRFYSAFDIFAFPSLFEGYGNVAIEAQATGLPVVASTHTPESIVLDCRSTRIELDAQQWREWIKRCDLTNNREAGHRLIQERKLSVEDEIYRVQNLYLSITNHK